MWFNTLYNYAITPSQLIGTGKDPSHTHDFQIVNITAEIGWSSHSLQGRTVAGGEPPSKSSLYRLSMWELQQPFSSPCWPCTNLYSSDQSLPQPVAKANYQLPFAANCMDPEQWTFRPEDTLVCLSLKQFRFSLPVPSFFS